jgi:transposase
MMGRQTSDQSQLFYLFHRERRIPASHRLRLIDPVLSRILIELREKLTPFYSEIGRPSIDPELMIRMLIIGYCYGIRSERRLCEELQLHLASCTLWKAPPRYARTQRRHYHFGGGATFN